MRACIHCGELLNDFETAPVLRQLHRECAARVAIGSIGHQLGLCPCRGGAVEDPEGMTKREAARAAFELARAGVNVARAPGERPS